MVAQFVAALERPVSRVRLENYRTPAVVDDLDMVVNYFFNVELSEALYPALQAFEVALRNSVHGTLTIHFKTARWYDRQGFLLTRQQGEIVEAKARLSRVGKPHAPDRVVAELHFGFWHSLFNTPFERNLWRPNKSALIGQVFPQISSRKRNRQVVWDRVDRIRIIRNRVMHYEPIWNRPNLSQDHAVILEALRWISEDMHETIAMCDRFPQILSAGRASIEQRIQAEIQRRYPPTPSTPTT